MPLRDHRPAADSGGNGRPPRAAHRDGGYVDSHQYATESRFLGVSPGGDGTTPRRPHIDLEYRHPLKNLLGKYYMRKLLG